MPFQNPSMLGFWRTDGWRTQNQYAPATSSKGIINFQQCWLISIHLFIKCQFILYLLCDSPPTFSPSLSIVWVPKFGHCPPSQYYLCPETTHLLSKHLHLALKNPYEHPDYSFPHLKFIVILSLSTVHHFGCFSQTNRDRFFWKIPTFY